MGFILIYMGSIWNFYGIYIDLYGIYLAVGYFQRASYTGVKSSHGTVALWPPQTPKRDKLATQKGRIASSFDQKSCYFAGATQQYILDYLGILCGR
jgi:hypothetical protein